MCIRDRLSDEEAAELRKRAKSIVLKGVRSPERLLDETALFLHRVMSDLPPAKQQMIETLHRSDEPLRGKKVLVVDDDIRNIFALNSLLERHSMQVISADNGQEAIKLCLLYTSPPDPDNTPRVDAMCTDASTDAIEAKLLAGGSGSCGLHIEGSGNTYTIAGACPDPMGGTGQMVTHGKIVWKSETEIHMESQSTSPHMSGSVVADAKWVGACPAGVMPGDQGSFVNGVFKKTGNIKDVLSKGG